MTAVRFGACVAMLLANIASGAFTLMEQVGCTCTFPDTDEVCTHIGSMADCQSAASALSKTYSFSYEIASNTYPGGCYIYKDYVLFYNSFTNITGAWYQGFVRHSLCEVIDEATTTPEPNILYDCEIGLPRSLVSNRKTGTCEGTLHTEKCEFQCEQGFYNADAFTVTCNNGTFSLDLPNATCSSDSDRDGFEFDTDSGDQVGNRNTATGCANADAESPVYSVAIGGASNVAQGCKATVIGGQRNTALGDETTVGGGEDNTAGTNYASIGGGQQNTAQGTGSTVIGGAYNVLLEGTTTSGAAYGAHNAIGGGYVNFGQSKTSIIAGGWANTNFKGRISSVSLGGRECFPKGSYSVVAGGFRNTAVSLASSIGGGYFNAILARHGAIPGGSRNTVKGIRGAALGHRAFVGGDYSLALSFKGDDCSVRTDKTVGMCAEHVYVNGVDLVDELLAGSIYGSRRFLTDKLQSDVEDAVVQKVNGALNKGNTSSIEQNDIEAAYVDLTKLRSDIAVNDKQIDVLLAVLSKTSVDV